ncbi:hypothetical protein GCM10028868_07810 [Virgibacillus kimchii]
MLEQLYTRGLSYNKKREKETTNKMRMYLKRNTANKQECIFNGAKKENPMQRKKSYNTIQLDYLKELYILLIYNS